MSLAVEAAADFTRVFRDKQVPSDMPVIHVKLGSEIRLSDLLLTENVLPSKKECVRLIKQGAVSINGDKVEDPFFSFIPTTGQVLKVGKRRFYRLES